MRSVKYLELVREKLDRKTDIELARKLGLSRAAVGHYLTGRRVMDEETCLAVAMTLEIEPMKVLMAAGIDRAEKAGQKSLWEVFSKRTATAAALVIVSSVNLFLTPTPSEAAQTLTEHGASSWYYVKCVRW